MTNTEFQRMCAAVHKNGWYIYDSPEGRIEVLDRGDYFAVYHSYREKTRSGRTVYRGRDCVDTADDLEKLKYLFVR